MKFHFFQQSSIEEKNFAITRWQYGMDFEMNYNSIVLLYYPAIWNFFILELDNQIIFFVFKLFWLNVAIEVASKIAEGFYWKMLKKGI